MIRSPTFNIVERKITIHYEYGGLHDGLVQEIRFGRDYIGSELLELRSTSEHLMKASLAFDTMGL